MATDPEPANEHLRNALCLLQLAAVRTDGTVYLTAEESRAIRHRIEAALTQLEAGLTTVRSLHEEYAVDASPEQVARSANRRARP